MTALPRRTDPSFAMYYDGIEASRFGLGGKSRRTALSGVLMSFTDSEVASTSSLLRVPNPSNSTIFAAHGTDAMTHSIRIKSAAGTSYFLMVTATATNRGGAS